MKFLLIFLFFNFYCHSQNDREFPQSTVFPTTLQIEGLIYYGEIQSMGLGGPIGPEYNAVLTFEQERSLYVTRQDSLEGENINGLHKYNTSKDRRAIPIYTNDIGFKYYNDLIQNQLYSRDIGFMYVKESIPEIKWHIHSEIKIIGKFEVKKATATFRGRKYTAWYTPEIPLPFGPWKLNGLPGLILEAYDTDKEIYWYYKDHIESAFVSLKPIDNGKNKWINFEEYKNRLLNAYQSTYRQRIKTIKKYNLYPDKEKNMVDVYIEDFETSQE